MTKGWTAPAVLAAFTAAYLGATELGLGLSLPGTGLVAFWPAAGLAVAVLVRTDRRWWPALLAVLVVTDAASSLHHDRTVGVAAGFAVAKAVEAVVVAALVRRGTGGRRIHGPGDLLFGLLGPAAVGAAVGAGIGAAVLDLSAGADVAHVFRLWLTAHLVGIVAISPIALVAPWRPRSRRDLGAIVLPLVVVGATAAAFAPTSADPASVTGARLAVAGLLVVAARVPLQVTAVTAAAVTSIAVWMTSHGHGPYVASTVLQADIDAVQTVVAVLVLGSLALAAAVERTRQSDARLRSIIDHLPHGAMVLEPVPRGGGEPGSILRPTDANPAMLHLFGVDDVDALGSAIGAAITRPDRVVGERRTGAIAAGAAESASGGMHVVAADGTERDIEWSLVRVLNADGVGCVLAQAVDLTERKAVERALRASEERFRLLAEHAPVGILLTDETGAATSVNAEWRRMAGAAPDEDDMGELWVRRIHPDDRARLAEGWERALAEGTTFDADYRLIAVDGTVRWVAGTTVPVFGEDGRLKGMVGTALDVSERKRHEEDLAFRAMHDGLTGLPNRQHFEDRVRVALAQLDGQRSVAVLFVDLDGFKSVNDTLGHDAGDLVLCEVASRLADVVRGPDVVARLGGDEFAVLCTGDVDLSGAQHLARRLRRRVAQPLVVGGHDVTVGVSIGVAATSDPANDVAQLLRAADQSMYGTKRASGPASFRR